MRMKYSGIKLLIFSALCPLFIKAQNIGIGTPAPVMKLHISSPSDTTLLQLDNNTTLNVNTNTGMYFKNGSYYTGAIKTIGTGTVFARLGFYTFAAGDPNVLQERMSIADNGFVGIGTNNPAALLDVNGSLKISGGSPGTGKILTSDASGNTSWETPAALNSGFKAVVGTGGFNVSSSTNSTIIFTAKDYDDPVAFFSTAFFAPANGLYHFDAMITWDITGVAPASQYVLALTVDGADKHGSVMQVPAGSPTRYRTQSISCDLKLTAGQTVSLYVNQDSGILQTILGSSGSTRYSYFSGRRVY